MSSFKKWIFILLICLSLISSIECCEHKDKYKFKYKKHLRELRGGYRYASPDERRKQGRSGYYSKKYEKYYAEDDIYFKKINGVGKTYEPLYVYFRPKNYYTPRGYFSPKYNETYYDGYGYNFFTGAKGYYQYSLNTPIDYSALYASMASTLCCLGCACCCQWLCNKETNYQFPDEMDDSSEKERKRKHNKEITIKKYGNKNQ